jgi:hypothetical protein
VSTVDAVFKIGNGPLLHAVRTAFTHAYHVVGVAVLIVVCAITRTGSRAEVSQRNVENPESVPTFR